MWKATAFSSSNRTWAPLGAIELEEGPFTSERALLASGGLLQAPYRHLLRHLEQEASSPALARDAIEVWAKAAQDESEYFDWAGAPRLKALEEALALFGADGQTTSTAITPSTLAWHDHTGVIITLSGDEEHIRLEYFPSTGNEHRLKRLRFRHAGAGYTLETILDWRGYFGRESGVIDGWKTMRRSGKGFVASLKGTFGIVVGSVLRRLTRGEPTLKRDPTARARLIRMSERYPHVAADCPDLSTIAPSRHDRAAVFVHGTVSCGIQGLKDLYSATARPPAPVYRYEHDTFLRLDSNGLELAGLIRDRLDAKHLLIAAHSRGGLVAKIAAHQLRRDGYPGDVSVYTFGTPYLGTPLVAQSKRALNLLFKLGEDLVGAIPSAQPLTKGFSYLVDAPGLPAGIGVMHEDSNGLSALALLGDPSRTRAWGGEFDINRAQSGFGVTVEGALLGALEGRAHDLVVPTASALGFGVAQPALSCAHLHYFVEPAVRSAIEAFLVPPALPAQVPASSAPAALSPAVDPTLEIVDLDDCVVIGGVKLKKRQAEPRQASDGRAADPEARPKENPDKDGRGRYKLR